MEHYLITGSLGNISKPVVQGLVGAGKKVTVVTSNPANVAEIEKLGAKALVGSLYDRDFVVKAFKGIEVAYTMIPPIWATDNWRKSQDTVAANYVAAIRENKTRFVVNLSSIGAHRPEGTGPVNALHFFENELNRIEGLNVKHLRPSYFYLNLMTQIPLIKAAGIMGANFGDAKLALVHTRDIAAIALDELLNTAFTGNSVRHIVGDLRSGKEIAAVLGKAIGKDLPWVDFTDEQQLKGMLDGGVPATHAPGYVEMGNAIRTGKMQEKIDGSVSLSPTKLEHFANEFAAAFKA